ncbi:phage scaffolding protein [Bacillus haynesii]|uniref:phage scaffolding protein n=1 Tax=Bacillus haynesii TaxID=1925021 RepID=UPI00227F3CEF|nr:scaffolding protein [Bacillus haynesii]MCY8347603.1 phage scaffolding protein [Bacillus haynesii]MCY8754824.1 phage scaffolding protein [Bacillus haynesii]MEC0709201.1 scaffolding protein [Bacillus haynesii]MEC0739181.1 scaffolding protein [Bacillus haynesii]
MTKFLPLNLQFFAEQPEPEDPNAQSTAGEPEPTPTEQPQGTEKTFTQAELDEILNKRLEREKKKQAELEEKAKRLTELEKAEEERKKAEMSEAERLRAEKEEAAKKAEEASEKAKKAEESANQRIINTELRAIARSLNANDPNQVLALLDKSAVQIDEDGNVIGAEEVVAAFKESSPWMFKQPIGADASGGSNPAKNNLQTEIVAKENELEETKKLALKNPRYLGKVTKLYNELRELKNKR